MTEITVEQAISRLSDEVRSDDAYAWTWHCNLAVSAYDAGLEGNACDEAARRFMHALFGYSSYPDLNESKVEH